MPPRLKARIDKLATSYGLKSADVIRIALRYSIDRFESNGIELTKSSESAGNLKGGLRRG